MNASDLLDTSFYLFLKRQDAVFSRFYELLFTRYPSAAPLFKHTRLASQEQMLAEALISIAEHLEDDPWMEQHVQSIGARHTRYGVEPEMYAWAGECLFDAMLEADSDEWNDEMARALRGTISVIVDHLTSGHNSALMRRCPDEGVPC